MAKATDLMVDGLAVWRITHLLVEDAFPPIADRREAIIGRYGEDHWISYLATCVYCTGGWVAIGAAVTRRARPGLWRAVAGTAALAAAAPLIEAALQRLEAGT